MRRGEEREMRRSRGIRRMGCRDRQRGAKESSGVSKLPDSETEAFRNL